MSNSVPDVPSQPNNPNPTVPTIHTEPAPRRSWLVWHHIIIVPVFLFMWLTMKDELLSFSSPNVGLDVSGTDFNFVSNSGICEKTAGVQQHSGYIRVDDQNLFFWLFEARHNATTTPLVLWLAGGPGFSSMKAIFYDNGACQFVNGSNIPSLNPHSFNKYANMLYVDQPVGAGFSYGKTPVNSTERAAPYIWRMLQTFYRLFPEYKNRDFGLFTSSYGGHYGPGFISYFLTQNSRIESGTIIGEKVPVVALGISNGWIDPHLHSQFDVMLFEMMFETSWAPLIKDCSNLDASKSGRAGCIKMNSRLEAWLTFTAACNTSFSGKTVPEIAVTIIKAGSAGPSVNLYDIRKGGKNQPNIFKPFVKYLKRIHIRNATGAKKKFKIDDKSTHRSFIDSGDRLQSYLPQLSSIVQKGITTLIWAGDADFKCNWMSLHDVTEAVRYPDSSAFKAKLVNNYTVDGVPRGEFKSEGHLSWLKVFDAGHGVIYDQPALAFQVFKQTMQKKPIFST